ncbi:MAG: sensor histidine kinase [Vicinamibacterales bacterium]
MRFKTWPVAALGLGSLLVLIFVSMIASSRKAEGIYTELDRLNTYHYEVDAKLRRLRSDVNLSGIFVRDYLLDVERERAPEYRQQLTVFRETTIATLAQLHALLKSDQDRIVTLQAQLDDYWETFDPLFDWTPTEKILRSATFLRREVVPRREAVLSIAQEIEELNNANLGAQRAEVARRQTALHDDLYRLLLRTILLGLAVALLAVYRLRVLERRSDEQRANAQAAEHRLRELSQQLVAAQEEERRHLSRELHDHVAQVLTALRMELGRIERVRPPGDTRVGAAVAEAKSLVDNMFRTVRDLALGLRPSMLDDFGLRAALEWHVRDFTRRSGLDVELQMEGDFDALPDPHRTCVYRAVQEALTNCARHAHAAHATVTVAITGQQLDLSVSDDGTGLDASRRANGLGLRGIEERVKELDGTFALGHAAGGRGTRLAVTLPLPAAESAEALRRAVS